MADASLTVALWADRPIPLDIALTCAPGEVLALVGPSGAGKSTVLRTIAGLYTPSRGTVRIGAECWLDTARGIDLPPHRRRVGLVFQNYALFPHMTALTNIVIALGHLPAAQRQDRARQLLDQVHLADFAARRPHELSGGQQQRVAVARALARDPAVLLLDEPFSAVDRVTRQKLYTELGELRGALDCPVLFVTHDFDEAARIASRMCLLDQGRILQTGTPRDVLARPATVTAARLVDMKNIFSARIVRHEAAATVIDWNGRTLTARLQPECAPGTPVSWSIPATNVLISRTDLSVEDSTPNRFAAEVRELVHLSQSLAATVRLPGPDAPVLSLTLPAHYARRTGLAVGSPITIALMPDGIHLMPQA